MKATKLSLLMLLALGLFYFSGCELTSTDDEDTGPVDNGELPIPMDQLLEAFKIENAVRKKGMLPSFNGKMADLKMNTDSIFLIKSFKNRVELFIPPSSGYVSYGITSYIQVEGSDEYFEAKPDPEQSNDSIAVYLMNFDLGAKETAMKFKIKWLVKDNDTGVPLDTIGRPVEVEPETDPCGLSRDEIWVWLWTTYDGEFESSPTYPGPYEFQTQGCCQDENSASPCLKADFVPLDYTQYAYFNEFIKFDVSNTAFSVLDINTQNLNYGDSDFCSGAAAYNKERREHYATADYTYNAQKNEVRFSNIESTARQVYLSELDQTVTEYDRVFISEDAVYNLVSCHFLLEIKSYEGLSQQNRLFQRRKGGNDGNKKWYD